MERNLGKLDVFYGIFLNFIAEWQARYIERAKQTNTSKTQTDLLSYRSKTVSWKCRWCYYLGNEQ